MLEQMAALAGYRQAPTMQYVLRHPIDGLRSWRAARDGMDRRVLGAGLVLLAAPAALLAWRTVRRWRAQQDGPGELESSVPIHQHAAPQTDRQSGDAALFVAGRTMPHADAPLPGGAPTPGEPHGVQTGFRGTARTAPHRPSESGIGSDAAHERLQQARNDAPRDPERIVRHDRSWER